MTKTELKENITKINKLLRSDSYEAGIELIKTLDDQEITKGTLKEVLKHPDYYESGIKSVKTLDVSVIDEGIIKVLLKQRDYDAIDTGIELARALDEPGIFDALLDGCVIDKGELTRLPKLAARPYIYYILWSLIEYLPKYSKSLKLSNITVLNLEPRFKQIKHGKKVVMSADKIDTLPKGFDKLKYLKTLDLNHNGFVSLPVEIEQLQSLEKLILDYNPISSFPAEIANLERLKYISLSSCPVLYVKAGIPYSDRRFKENIKGLKELHLNNIILKGGGLPSSIGVFKSLEILNLSSNYLTKLPDEISKLENLVCLDLGSNKFNDFPKGICKLKKLKELNISKNKGYGFFHLTKTIKSLQILDLSNTYLANGTINLIGKMKNLRSLNLSDTGISFPSFVYKLDHLETLDLSRNSLRDTIDDWKGLTKLRNLKTLVLGPAHWINTTVDDIKKLLPNTEIIVKSTSASN